jgi:hypothetical protein
VQERDGEWHSDRKRYQPSALVADCDIETGSSQKMLFPLT